jgi:2-polyprenyl-6-methoxyphenol hydroxylase-like FAD-dependent oxidoreductase
MQHPAVAIVGAGPAGLTIANILHRHGRQVTVFETDASADARDQGGTLDLHRDGGQLALERAGLLDAFLSLARHEDQEQRVVDHATGALLREEIPEPGNSGRPEIDRLVLRQLLLHPLPDKTVRWDAQVEEVIVRPEAGYDLRLREEIASPFDLVIGADGAGSRVRRALTDIRPDYTGVAFVELWLADVDVRHPVLARLVGHGTMFALGNGAGIFAQRNGGATIRVYAAFRTRPEDTERPDRTLAGITTSQVLARFEEWAPSLRALIADADHIAAVRPIVALPPELRWEQKSGLTLVGDAAHVMPPLGVGVNLAMLDAADLAEALVAGSDWRQAVRDYEALMIERAARLAIDCNRAFEAWFGADGIRAVLDDIEMRHAGLDATS